MEELKPCPFCDGKDAKALLIGGLLKVLCPACKASTGLYNTETEAITAWNTRPDAFIKITPTTKMPEKDTGDFFNVITDGDVEVCFYDGDWDCPNIGYLKNVTYYQKINLPEN